MKALQTILLAASILFLNLSSMAQTNKYNTEWKKVETLLTKENKPQSALAEVRNIYALAKKEGQDAHVIKALVYMTGLQESTREDNQALSIQEIESEITSAKEPARSILQSMLAGKYWEYYTSNRWNLFNRTNTAGFDKKDIATWTADDLHSKISSLYLASIKNESLLQKTDLSKFEPIIEKGNVRHLRPTLYDLLAHRALGYFQNDERNISKPAYAFELKQAEAFAPASRFVKYNFTTKDSLSLHHKALLVYQNLISFHLKNARPDALLDADISRLQFVYNNSVHEEKDSLYLNALEQLISQYSKVPAIKQAQFLLARWYDQKAGEYEQNKDSAIRYLRVKARDILLDAVRDSSVKNEGWTNSFNLLQNIERKAFYFELEKVNLPGTPFRSLVEYRNIPSLYLRLIPINPVLERQMTKRENDDEPWKTLVAARSIKNWQQNLPATHDFQPHDVEIKIDGLPVGEYYLLASADPDFNFKKEPIGYRKFHVSEISFINNNREYFVLHRQTGQPLAGAKASVFNRTYDYNSREYRKNLLGKYTTDPNGYFRIDLKEKANQSGYFVELAHGKDFLRINDLTYDYWEYYDSRNKKEKHDQVFFFLDRSIYRPGQTLHFKGIALKKNNRENEILAGKTATIYLKDANWQVIDSIQLTTNEFGSFHGKFQLPAGSLNGVFHLEIKEEGNIAFNVEDYKRPKFYVEFEKVQESFKLGDTIHLTGMARAYAGNNLDKASVSWRVVRQPRFIYTWFISRWWMPPTKPMEIAHGVSTTDSEGNFQVQFNAIADKSIDPKFDPLFDYRIYADVTDINGETRSGEQVVTIGYKSIVLNIQIPERMPTDSFHILKVFTENMSGVYQPAQLAFRLSKLQPEQRLIRRRYWQEPDQFVFTKEEYLRHFPNDEYKNETDPQTWERTELFNWEDSSRMDGSLRGINRKLDPGHYALEITTRDKDGKEIKDIRYVEIFDPASNKLTKPEYLWTLEQVNPLEPGEKANIQIGSSANDIFLIRQTIRPGTLQYDTTLSFDKLDQERKNYVVEATEKDRGGLGLAFIFIKNNRVYNFQNQVNIPWSNKELKIEYASFRDKTLPGSEEQWKVKISGHNNEKLAAEMLVSMYDASLDQFSPHQWNKPGIWPNFYFRRNWEGNTNFASARSDNKWIVPTERNFEKTYDNLKLDLFDQWRFTYALQGRAPGINIAALSNKREIFTDSVDTGFQMTPEEIKEQKTDNTPVQIRRNFNETAFFFPDLRTDAEGNVEFSFTTPEALTSWKLQTLAHTKDLAFGYDSRQMVTQKELMVQPNLPRFLRQGDKIEIPVKISNITSQEMTGQVELLLFDAATLQPVDGWFLNTFPNQYFTVGANSSEVVQFPITVPAQFTSALSLRVIARAGNISDGEENILPVLSNKMLVTETMPLPLKGYETKSFDFTKLLESGNSPTLQHHALTVEYTSNPAWYAIQALPYLMEYPYDCAEQIWNRYYANAVAAKIANSTPRIKAIFEQWKTIDTAALLSNLEKNQELKNALLEETPWVMQAKTESERKRNIALLFDLVKLGAEMESNLAKLKDMQSPNGGFVWFKGGPDDRYVTQYIVMGIGRLRKIGVDISQLQSIVNRAIPYLDERLAEDYNRLIQQKADLKKQFPGQLQVQYLYMRSFFPEIKINNAAGKANDYYREQAVAGWTKLNPYLQGMLAIALSRTGKHQEAARRIMTSLKENSIYHEELGRYWKDQRIGYSWFWWYAPIETQALMIEAFDEVLKEASTVNELKTWLVKHKQTNNWRTTRATADAIYALLLRGSNWLDQEPIVSIQLGSTTLSSTTHNTEAGTGYFSQTIDGQKIKPEMGKIEVKVEPGKDAQTSNPLPSWGAVYWQYFEEMDKITSASTPLQLQKKVFVETNTDRGPVLQPVQEGSEVKVGDKITVRIELRVDRDMEYVHMKDMRAAALEPINVLSGYRWKGGLGYYETTRDAATHFFIDFLRKGTYVFEYSLFVNQSGDFSNGVTTIECMYAPEFRAQSEGMRLSIAP